MKQKQKKKNKKKGNVYIYSSYDINLWNKAIKGKNYIWQFFLQFFFFFSVFMYTKSTCT